MFIVKSSVWYTAKVCQQNPKALYVFGDNVMRIGCGGQAIIRNEPNAFGIATKYEPTMNDVAFFSDKYPGSYRVIIEDVMKLVLLTQTPFSDYDTVVFPGGGLGTGLSKLPEKAPDVYRFLCQLLYKLFGVDYRKTSYVR